MGLLKRAALAAALVLAGLPAQAFQLTVLGVTYDITLNLGSYDTVNAGPNGPLTATPWFGDFLLGSAFQTELRAQDIAASGNLVPDPNAIYLFAYLDLGANMQAFAYDPSEQAGSGETFVLNTVKSFPNLIGSSAPLYFATGSAIPLVPEINGNALAQALLCLMALGVWLRARRGRRAQAG
jgi:hypothetical protein